jgi:hypothetical protein
LRYAERFVDGWVERGCDGNLRGRWKGEERLVGWGVGDVIVCVYICEVGWVGEMAMEKSGE